MAVVHESGFWPHFPPCWPIDSSAVKMERDHARTGQRLAPHEQLGAENQ
jgi:hypothetical protein